MGSGPPLGDDVRARLGTPQRPRRLESSPRSRVWRTELSGTPAVVKQLVEGPEADERFTREVAALRLAALADPPVAPRLLATDPDERLLVLEHLDHRRPSQSWLVQYAAALARLHAATGLKGADPRDTAALPLWSGPTRQDTASFLALADALQVPLPPGVERELDALVARLCALPGRSLLHGDPCPGNDLHTPDGIRFIDFEQASLGPGAVELAYLRIGFPTCWCVTAPSPGMLRRAESAYEEAWRAATGTAVQGDVVDACAGWLIRGDALVQRAHRDGTDHLARLVREDWEWGTATARERLAHRLGVVAEVTGGRADLAALRHLSRALRTAVLARWPSLRAVPSRRP